MGKSSPHILLITPSLKEHGGVTEFNKMLIKYSRFDFTLLEFKTGSKTQVFLKLGYLLFTYAKFFYILLYKKIEIVHVNPSLGKTALIRDGLYIVLAKLFNKKVYVHWHGWNPQNEYLLIGKYLRFCKRTIFKANHIKVLSVIFAKKLKEKGYSKKITLGTTFVDDELLNNLPKYDKSNDSINLLFLSTISINKGIYIALEVFKKVHREHPRTSLTIAGTGSELENIKQIVESQGLKNIKFTGYVTGVEKSLVFLNSDIYIFPSFYEGMPTSLLEAMCFGLPIVTSAVGAIPEFFENEKMGHLIFDNHNVSAFYNAVGSLIVNKERRIAIGNYNKNIGLKRYLASNVILQIERDYLSL